MASFHLHVSEFIELDEVQRIGLSAYLNEGCYKFQYVNALEPSMWLPVAGIEAIRDKITKVTVQLDDPWIDGAGYKEDAERYFLGGANGIIRREAQHVGGAHAYINYVSRLQISGPTLQSVLELIFAMKRGEAMKVGDPTFAEYAKERGIPYSALKKSWKQRLQDWWKKVKIGFLNYVKPLPIPRDVAND